MIMQKLNMVAWEAHLYLEHAFYHALTVCILCTFCLLRYGVCDTPFQMELYVPQFALLVT